MLDWATLHPVERLELLTNHDLARQEKQKLELLRGLLTYYHYATTESRQEVLQTEINRINAAANEQRDRYRSQFAVEQEARTAGPAGGAGVGRRAAAATAALRGIATAAVRGSATAAVRGTAAGRMTTRRRRTTRNLRTMMTTPRPG